MILPVRPEYRVGVLTVICSMCVAVNEIPQYSQLVLSVCETLQDEVIALFDQTRHSLTLGDATDDKDSMETDDASRVKHKDQRDGVKGQKDLCMLGTPFCCLLPPKEALAVLTWDFLHGILVYVSLGSWLLCLSFRSVLRNIVTIYMRARKCIVCNVRDSSHLNI